MSLQDFVKLLRSRWITVCVTTLVAVLGAIVLNLATTPLYQASTRLFVSTSSNSSLSDLYQGNRLSQDRVLSYTELLMGETLAQRTIDKLGLDMSADELKAHINASAKRDTVLIDVAVQDESPVRARDIANALSDEFVILIRELETPNKGGTPDARVVVEQRASIPAQPVVPKKARNVVVGLAIGVTLGIGLAVLRDLLDNTVKNVGVLEEITGVGLVGNVPLDKERRKEPAISFDTDNSIAAEAFRKLRTNLQFLAVDNPPRLIVVTSSNPSEGKSTTAINIALALAEAEHNVVLVDGDMRRPSLAQYLELIGPVGFSTVVSGGASLSDALQNTKFPRLSVLTSGTVPPNPSELLGSLTAQKVLSELRERFDFVIVDSSPLLAVTDAAILAANADGVLVIARFGQTKREQLAHAIGNLKDVGASLLGAVFTMTPARGSASYSYYGYSNADDKNE
ncbi:polysaccharide biosynthesis tyrosine autokinase [Mycobacterium sp. CVI_P3]|uniref:non-specific protein-tyrosine kinase n=1 Tax=Mycobacterium pinniadriaticum TaxID=2994102 RepID=A0ABT3SNB5_9MYCO|nr:polysaccharide biosynthesis tyrosine autokinase [Mycobacterium pinniadriaticum]MCX2934605.1 polysaccharide biosynthesis tyrosine autokinase [Mycobacterium pinniadriaticum]MCX2941028.1 polysaccharide biosynthesis tyrosine autokinase [Mycobacterium pinniadriaticum]